MRQAERRNTPVAGIFAGMILVSGIAWFAWVVLNAPRIRAERAASLLAEIAAENDESCERLGMGPGRGPQVFSACARELEAVRRRQQERLESPYL